MRFLLQVALCFALAGSGMAQRGGGGGRAGGGGFGGGRGGMGGGGFAGMGGRGFAGGGGRGFVGGGGFAGGGRGFVGGGSFSGLRGGINFRGIARNGSFFRGGRSFIGTSVFWPYGIYPAYGFGLGYWGDYGYPYSYYPYSYYPYGDTGYASYQSSPNVVVVYPESTAAANVSSVPARPLTRQYDQYGQEVTTPGGTAAAGSPIYLIAFTDHTIRAAAAYWVDGSTLHYVTLEREEKQAPLDTVDRAFSQQLNRERQVPFQLPAQ